MKIYKVTVFPNRDYFGGSVRERLKLDEVTVTETKSQRCLVYHHFVEPNYGDSRLEINTMNEKITRFYGTYLFTYKKEDVDKFVEFMEKEEIKLKHISN